MNATRGLAAVIGALAAFRAIVLIWGFAAGYALPTPIWMRLALVAVSTLGILAGARCARRSHRFPRVLWTNNNWRVQPASARFASYGGPP